jgi:hypothetical protein
MMSFVDTAAAQRRRPRQILLAFDVLPAIRLAAHFELHELGLPHFQSLRRFDRHRSPPFFRSFRVFLQPHALQDHPP